jgi:hypothetical protein
LTQQPQGKIGRILDLIDAEVTLDTNGQSVTYSSPFTSSPIQMALYLPILMDKLTTLDSPIIPGRININEAPRQILVGIPGMTEEIVDQIMETRNDGSDDENRRFETWLLVEGLVSLDQMKTLSALLTGGGDVHRAQVVGYYENGSAFSRLEAIIDAAESPPKVTAYRRMDHLGRGFSNVVLGQRSAAMLGMNP